jgi:DNA-binding response OmpR family regulator
LLNGEDHTPPPNVKKTGRTSISILELKVEDNGAGISNDQLKKIFERFYQTDTSATREHEGSGIGLALVRELVDLHGGEVAVESQPGIGACFTVRLPLLAADFEQLTVAKNTVDADDQSARRFNDEEFQVDNLSAPVTEGAPLILIVEDNADIRHFIRESLYPDYSVIEAADGAAGYRLAVETIPDLILSDLMMPKMDGVELCRKLKQENKTDHIPIVMLTAKASGESKIEGLETGADDYIIKPFEAAELLARIKNLIDGRKKLRERFSREITLQPASIAITSMDEKLLQHVMRIMEEHMADSDFGVGAFCREAGMSRTQLHRKLKALTDQSTGDFIRIMRLKRAAELLTNHAGSIAEVAFMVGFNDPSYFTKCFQKQFGRTPSEFVAQNLVP